MTTENNSVPIFERWCIFVTKLLIYKDRIEKKSLFGLSTHTIPMSKVASVQKSLTKGLVFETTGGGKDVVVALWNRKYDDEVIRIVLDLIK